MGNPDRTGEGSRNPDLAGVRISGMERSQGARTIALTAKEAATAVGELTGIKQTVDWGGSPESRLALLTYNYSKLGAGDPEAFLARVPESVRATLSG